MRATVYIEKRILPPSRKHPNGRVRYYVTSEVDGIKRSHGGFNTKRDAQARKRLIESQIADGTFGKVEKRIPYFRDFYQEWWARKKLQLSTSADISYDYTGRKYVVPFFGHMTLLEITPEVVQKFVDSLDHLSARYVRTIFARFRSCSNTAADLEIIPRSPCKRITLPKVLDEIKQYFGPSDIWKILAGLDAPYDALFAILAFSGMRIGECLGLKWKHINFDKALCANVSETPDPPVV